MKKINKGLTLMELLIYLGIMSVVLLAITILVATTLRHQTKAQENLEVSQNMQLVLEKLSYDILSSKSFIIPNPQRLELTDGQNNQTIYQLSSDTPVLEYSLANGPLAPLTSTGVKVTQLEFQGFGNLAVKIKISLTSQDDKFTLSNQISLRPEAQ
mgnify:CR=1 FL=1